MLSPTATENEDILGSLTISPNPSNGWFNIHVGNNKLENAKVIISGVSGKQAAALNLVAGNNNYDLSYLG